MMNMLTSVVNSYHLTESVGFTKKTTDKKSFDATLNDKLKVVKKVEGPSIVRPLDNHDDRSMHTKVVMNEDGSRMMLVIQDGIVIRQMVLNDQEPQPTPDGKMGKVLKAYGLS